MLKCVLLNGFAPGDVIFIVGTALKNESFASDYQADLKQKIEELKHDQMKKITDSSSLQKRGTLL